MLFGSRINIFNIYLLLFCVVGGIIASIVSNSTLVQQFVVLLWSLAMIMVVLRALQQVNHKQARRSIIYLLTLVLISIIFEIIYYAKYTGKTDIFTAKVLIISASLIRIGIFSYGWLDIVYRLTHKQKVTGETIASAIIAYLLIAVICFYLYLIFWQINPNGFKLANIYEYQFQPWNLAMYFSLITITTVGYGDIIPVARSMMVIASFEAIFGAFYLTVIVARLVSLFGISDKSD